MTDKLTSDLIGDPNIWRMAMLISDDALDVVAYSTVEDNSMLYRHIRLDTAAADRVKALEEVVYENPLLLAAMVRRVTASSSSVIIYIDDPGILGYSGDL